MVATSPVTKRPQDWRVPILNNGETVGGRFHGGTLYLDGGSCKVPRTVKGKTRFPFRITIVPPGKPERRSPWIGTHRWKHRAIYTMKMKLSIQIEKALTRASWKWFKFYSVRGYGVPGRLEFICPYSSMVAKTICQQEAISVRRYWALCAEKSQEVLDWLCQLDPARYSAQLHSYLLRAIIVSYNAREINKYEQSNPFRQVKPWQEL